MGSCATTSTAGFAYHRLNRPARRETGETVFENGTLFSTKYLRVVSRIVLAYSGALARRLRACRRIPIWPRRGAHAMQ